MKSKHPELRWLARAAYDAIQRWEDANGKAQPTEEPDPDRSDSSGNAHSAARCECDGLTGSDDPDYRDRSGVDLDRALSIR